MLFIIANEINGGIYKTVMFKRINETNTAEVVTGFNADKITNLKRVFSDKYLKNAEEFIREFDLLTDKKLKNLKLANYKELYEAVSIFSGKYISKNESNKELSRLLIEMNCHGGYIFPIQYMGHNFGFIFIETEQKFESEDILITMHLIEVLSLYLEKKRLEISDIDVNDYTPFRCSVCNRMLLTFKGKVDLVETKCPKCSSINRLSM